MAKELIDYIREIHKVAGSQVGVHFGEKSPYHIREILRICEAAQQSVQRIGLYCAACGSELGENDTCPRMCSQDTPNR